MDSSSEAPGHFGESVSLLPSLAEVVVSSDVLIHLLKQLLQSLQGLPSEVLVAEPPELFQLKCLSHASGAITHLNRNNPSVLQI
jgi:hypothetical protein